MAANARKQLKELKEGVLGSESDKGRHRTAVFSICLLVLIRLFNFCTRITFD